MREFFGDTRLTMCSRVTQTCHGGTTGLACALGGITPHCAKRAPAGRTGLAFRAFDDRDSTRESQLSRHPSSHRSRSWIGGVAGGWSRGLSFSWPIFRSCGQAGASLSLTFFVTDDAAVAERWRCESFVSWNRTAAAIQIVSPSVYSHRGDRECFTGLYGRSISRVRIRLHSRGEHRE